jgi:hypothetical protein
VSNARFRARASERHSDTSISGVTAGLEGVLTAMEGSEAQDLFYYSTKELTLRRGERAVVEVFRARVPYRHVYTWDIGPTGGGNARQHGSSPTKLNRNHVWHQVVLTNMTRLPWTTGPAMLMQDGRALGQDLMTFTPKGREVMVPVTQAVSLRGTMAETELSRKHGAETFNGYRYTRIEARRTFRVRSSLDRKVRLVITATLNGESLEADQKGKIEYSGQNPVRRHNVPILNLYSKVAWDLTIPARSDRSVSVRYHYYVRE